MATDGLEALSSVDRNEVVIAEMTAEENRSPGASSRSLVERRINESLGRSDLRVPVVLRYEDKSKFWAGMTFAEYRRTSVPVKTIYKCIRCDAEARQVMRWDPPQDFKVDGGTITLLPSLELE